MSDSWYSYGSDYVLVRTGMPQDAVKIGIGESYADAVESLQTTPIQSVGRDSGESSALRWAFNEGWIDDPDSLEPDDGPSDAPPFDPDDADSVAHEMALALEVSPDDLQVTSSHMESFGVSPVWSVGFGGQKEYLVVADEDAARELALAVVKQDLEHEPEIFTQSFLEQHIDTDRLRRDLASDVENMIEEDLREQRPERFWREAEGYGMSPVYVVNWDNPHASGTLSGEYDDESDAEQAGEDWLAEMIAADPDPEEAADDYSYEVVAKEPDDSEIADLAERMAEERLRDPIAYLEDIYGREDALKQAISIAGIDVDAAAEDAVDTDGWEHFLARYDGNSYETPGGLTYWREN